MEFNPKCDKNELFAFLVQKGIEEDDAKKIREEKVDGETFREITEGDLKDIGVKLGTRKKILKIIKALKSAPKPQTFPGTAQVQDVQIVGNEPFMSNSFVFDLLTSGSPKILTNISSKVPMPTTSQNSITVSSASSMPPSFAPVSSASSSSDNDPTQRYPDYPRKRMRPTVPKSKAIPESLYEQNRSIMSHIPRNGYFDSESIDVLAMLKDHVSGDKILYNLKTRKSINRSDINEIVRIVVRDMVDDLRTLYPNTEQKHNLAKAIVRDIPELKSTREGVMGYEQFYDPSNNSGSIEWRLKTMRKVMPLSKRKNKSPRTKTQKLIEAEEEEIAFEYSDEILEKINWLKCQPAVECNKAQIMEYMADTFLIRRAYLTKNCPNIPDILDVYPKLKEFDGAVIEDEFNRIHPNARKLIEELPEYSEKISLYVSQQRHDIEERVGIIPDNNLRIMMYLADLLPVPGMKKDKTEDNKKIYPSNLLMTFTGMNTMFSLTEPCLTPTLLACGEMKDDEIQYFLIIDREFVNLGKCFLKAFDILYKSFFVFNVDYPKHLVVFYDFLDHMIYKVNTGVARSSVEHLNNVISVLHK